MRPLMHNATIHIKRQIQNSIMFCLEDKPTLVSLYRIQWLHVTLPFVLDQENSEVVRGNKNRLTDETNGENLLGPSVHNSYDNQ